MREGRKRSHSTPKKLEGPIMPNHAIEGDFDDLDDSVSAEKARKREASLHHAVVFAMLRRLCDDGTVFRLGDLLSEKFLRRSGVSPNWHRVWVRVVKFGSIPVTKSEYAVGGWDHMGSGGKMDPRIDSMGADYVNALDAQIVMELIDPEQDRLGEKLTRPSRSPYWVLREMTEHKLAALIDPTRTPMDFSSTFSG